MKQDARRNHHATADPTYVWIKIAPCKEGLAFSTYGFLSISVYHYMYLTIRVISLSVHNSLNKRVFSRTPLCLAFVLGEVREEFSSRSGDGAHGLSPFLLSCGLIGRYKCTMHVTLKLFDGLSKLIALKLELKYNGEGLRRYRLNRQNCSTSW